MKPELDIAQGLTKSEPGMNGGHTLWRACTHFLVAVATLAMIGIPPVQAQTFDVLYQFTGYSDGATPEAPVIVANGFVYGTAEAGGGSNEGTLFRLTTKGKEVVLHDFSKANGSSPLAGLAMDSAGNFYGTTALGGDLNCPYDYENHFGCGVAFKLDASGTYTVLHSFAGGLMDGAIPSGGVVMDSAGNLYGMTEYGGNETCAPPSYECGIIFKVDASGTETVLYKFTGGSDGGQPFFGSLVIDAAGNLYGATHTGGDPTCNNTQGTGGCGSVFELAPDGALTVMYNFTGGRDGAYPYGGLVRDDDGNLFGTTYQGGYSEKCLSVGCGVVFKVDPSGAETVLYRFHEGADGEWPYAGLVLDHQGNLYGTTYYGGGTSCFDGDQNGCGIVFKIDASGTETVLHRLTPSEGQNPIAGLVMDANNVLYGTARWGGEDGKGYGTVFRLKP